MQSSTSARPAPADHNEALIPTLGGSAVAIAAGAIVGRASLSAANDGLVDLYPWRWLALVGVVAGIASVVAAGLSVVAASPSLSFVTIRRS